MDILINITAILVFVAALGYIIISYRKGSISVKGVTYSIDQTARFALGASIISTFALIIIAMLIARDYMFSTLLVKQLSIAGGAALITRSLLLFLIQFGLFLGITFFASQDKSR